MKLSSFDYKLIAVRPDKYIPNTTFTDNVMFAIKNNEILSSSVRRMNVTKKETFMKKLKRLPAFAIIAIALGVLVLLSGSAYAAYQLLWPKPEVHVTQSGTSTSGRQEVSLSFEQCSGDDIASHYELKKKATITADEVPMVVQAHCELDAIGDWANNTFPNDGFGINVSAENTEHDETKIAPSMATHIKSRDASSITFEGLTKYNQTDTTLAVSSDVRYIANGKDVDANQISSDDAVVYITSNTIHMTPTAGGSSGSLTTSKLVAVVKLDMPFQYYDQFAWQSLTELTTCEGNPNDTCLSGYAGAIDLYQGGASPVGSQMKEIQGVITELNGKTTTIRSTSGTLFTITTPTDVVATYNTQKARQYYNGQTVAVGNSLVVRYVEAANQHSYSLDASSLMSVQLQIELVGKSDPINAY